MVQFIHSLLEAIQGTGRRCRLSVHHINCYQICRWLHSHSLLDFPSTLNNKHLLRNVAQLPRHKMSLDMKVIGVI